jgi:hypothetical protein
MSSIKMFRNSRNTSGRIYGNTSGRIYGNTSGRNSRNTSGRNYGNTSGRNYGVYGNTLSRNSRNTSGRNKYFGSLFCVIFRGVILVNILYIMPSSNTSGQ